MKFEVEPVDVDIRGAKRQHLPIKLHWTCPSCERERTVDFSEAIAGKYDGNFLQLPIFGYWEDYGLYCKECDDAKAEGGWCFHVRIRMSLQVDVKEDE